MDLCVPVQHSQNSWCTADVYNAKYGVFILSISTVHINMTLFVRLFYQVFIRYQSCLALTLWKEVKDGIIERFRRAGTLTYH